MHESVKECLWGKRTELLKAMLVEARVPSPDNVCPLRPLASSQCKCCRQFYAAPCGA